MKSLDRIFSISDLETLGSCFFSRQRVVFVQVPSGQLGEASRKLSTEGTGHRRPETRRLDDYKERSGGGVQGDKEGTGKPGRKGERRV